eukprot:TRINITY_DN3568_c0_g1_i3.p2 TRINITY_DN3568_c0_g1~~TRINITY_DN3568_c0_g1_i3.p2  ORF type:complete len:113 (-),score=26.08 TRINITY_DN3568_c0_g1_i3:258-596(-)
MTERERERKQKKQKKQKSDASHEGSTVPRHCSTFANAPNDYHRLTTHTHQEKRNIQATAFPELPQKREREKERKRTGKDKEKKKANATTNSSDRQTNDRNKEKTSEIQSEHR